MYSPYIDLILRWLAASRVQVHQLMEPLPRNAVGVCYNMEDDGVELIEFCAVTAYDALLTLAHESGHWLGNTTFGHKKHGYQRERQAKVYGWRVLVLVGANRVVTRRDWMEFHK